MTLQQAIERLNAFEEAQQAYRQARTILSLDGATAAPRQSVRGRERTMGYLSGELYRLTVTGENREALETILANPGEVDAVTLRRAEKQKEELDDMTRIPMEEYVAFERLCTEADAVWHEAKEKSDYPAFAPYLARLIDYQRRFAQRKDNTRAPYDVLLDTYEKGTSMAMLDPFFDLLRRKLTPVILAVKERPAPRTDFLHQSFPVHQQRVFADRLMDMMGIDRSRCAIAETEHPFTDSCSRWDVRITTHYYEHDVASGMYSVIHEGGHALYELGVSEALSFTCLESGSTMGIHESQSRLYENLIGRSLPFCRAVLPVMRDCFPEQLRGVTPEMLYAAVNDARPSLKRTEADELTYGMHVLIRYELEKRMLRGDVTVQELPDAWNELYRSCLGVEVPCDREGILQDSHWSGGAFGYFPSYALGSAYGVQMLRNMERSFDPWPQVERGDLSGVNAWLGEHIHRHGCLLRPQEILRDALGGAFDPQVYVDYLTQKFTALYQL